MSSTPTVLDGSEYIKLDEIEHVIQRSEVYIPTLKQEERETFGFDFESGKLVRKKFTFSPGVIHLFCEILSNAGDNVDRSRRENFPIGAIEVNIDVESGRVSVKNGGRPIPVVIHATEGKYVPELIFGELRTSSAYGDSKRTTAGMNGLGAKLVNILSDRFIVKVNDSVNGKSFFGEWSSNMRNYSGSKITNFRGKTSSVEIEYYLDFSKTGEKKYTPEALSLIMKSIVGISCSNKIPIKFNDVEMNYANTHDLIKLIWNEELIEKSVSYYEWSNPPEEEMASPGKPKKKKSDLFTSINPKMRKINWMKNFANIELYYFDTPDDSEVFTFVNGVNSSCGVHVEAAYRHFSNIVIPNLKKGETEGIRITAKDVKNHVSILMICKLVEPEFSGNVKDRLTKPTPRIELEEEPIMKKVNKWNLITRLNREIKAKDLEILKETDGVGKDMVYNGRNGNDANLAGTSESPKCVLNVMEGSSASRYVDRRIDYTGGHEYNGRLELRGKVLNVTNASATQIRDNKELVILKQMLNLEQGVDYTIPENRKKLKYGYVNICTDADDDGKHIASLLINFFQEHFPSILKNGMVAYLRLPVIKVRNKKGATIREFSSTREYDRWIDSEDYQKIKNKIGETQYFKGLGTFENEDIAADVESAPCVKIIVPDEAEASTVLRTAFDSKHVQQRRKWITDWRNVIVASDIEITPYSEFLDSINRIKGEQSVVTFFQSRWVDYSISNLIRSIPCYYDGFKDVHRKIVWTALNNLKVGSGKMKVAELAAIVSAEASYHHGPKSLEDAINRMLQTFVGTNNLPIMKIRGQQGTREYGPKYLPAARYVLAELDEVAPLIFDQELISMVPRNTDDGKQVENVWLPSIVPMCLINGSTGVGSGNSTFIPNHNPKDVIDALLDLCQGKEPKPFIPFYRGFTGTIKLATEKDKERDEDEISHASVSVPRGEDDIPEVDPEFLVDRDDFSLSSRGGKRNTLITRGTYEIKYEYQNKRKSKFNLDDPINCNIEVTELPIGKWCENYVEILKEWKEQGIIKNFDRHHRLSEDKIKFILYGFRGAKLERGGAKKLKLETSLSMSNLTLINLEGIPRRFENVIEVLKAYYSEMIVIFEKFRRYKISSLQSDIDKKENKMLFINLLLKGEIIIFVASENEKRQVKRKQQEIIDDMSVHGINDASAIYNSTSLKMISVEEIQKLAQEIEELQKIKEYYRLSTAESLWIEKLKKLYSYVESLGEFN